MIAGIAISSAAFAMDKPYSYRVPEGMSLSPGQRVTVPFGRGNIRTEGIVLSLTEGEAAALAEAHHVLPRRDAASGALSFSYTEGSTRHRVWYADSETLARWAAELDTCAGKTVPISIWRVD